MTEDGKIIVGEATIESSMLVHSLARREVPKGRKRHTIFLSRANLSCYRFT